MSISLRTFLETLDRHTVPIPVETLTDRLGRLSIGLEDVKEVLRFSDRGYRRNMFHEGPCYHALVLCWKSRQKSLIHDHLGSACGVRILSGVATETTFERDERGRLHPMETTHHRKGAVCASRDRDIHQVSNEQAGGRSLVTLHVYSPPLIEMNIYSMINPEILEVIDPVYSLHAGAGI